MKTKELKCSKTDQDCHSAGEVTRNTNWIISMEYATLFS